TEIFPLTVPEQTPNEAVLVLSDFSVTALLVFKAPLTFREPDEPVFKARFAPAVNDAPEQIFKLPETVNQLAEMVFFTVSAAAFDTIKLLMVSADTLSTATEPGVL